MVTNILSHLFVSTLNESLRPTSLSPPPLHARRFKHKLLSDNWPMGGAEFAMSLSKGLYKYAVIDADFRFLAYYLTIKSK